ncbi:MAG: allophanate hydrolase subunit 1 [Gordonia sp. (in: high G+C Gram-positive bacteria)]|jgi:KipI family sensor histidine kinase inhibitor|nr:allophanate hydrolase subunit 1 [Gordonia sp. (in: high G+C Gram-positive bacteria)]
MRERTAGDDGLLLDFGSTDRPGRTAARVADALRDAASDGRLALSDVVACAETVLVEALPGTGLNELGVRRVVHDLLATAVPDGAEGISSERSAIVIPVRYDGADLSSAAVSAGCSTDRLVLAHTHLTWTVQFMGFAPGFGYLVPEDGSDPALTVLFDQLPRREESRPRVPAGSVAVAAGYSAVYPRVSPGGWHLLGVTDAVLWDSTATPPAVFSAGARVRFVRAEEVIG